MEVLHQHQSVSIKQFSAALKFHWGPDIKLCLFLLPPPQQHLETEAQMCSSLVLGDYGESEDELSV